MPLFCCNSHRRIPKTGMWGCGWRASAPIQMYDNPCTPPPPRSLARKKQWTLRPMYPKPCQLLQPIPSYRLCMSSNNIYTPGYATYENGTPTRVALFNFIRDPSGASNYTASISLPQREISNERVKHLATSLFRTATPVPANVLCQFSWLRASILDISGPSGIDVERRLTEYGDHRFLCDCHLERPWWFPSAAGEYQFREQQRCRGHDACIPGCLGISVHGSRSSGGW
ncbi:hypothetical protein JB92DRAFT_3292213 [Gautieria morchelliformis]|nr:hypothetical protein JB92DRAFT_3292213 [Gautieria morchelliformis]